MLGRRLKGSAIQVLRRLEAPIADGRRQWLVFRLKVEAKLRNARLEIDIPKGVVVGRRVEIEIGHRSESSITFHPTTAIGNGVLLRLRGGRLVVGPDVKFRSNVVLNLGGGTLQFDGPNEISWGTIVHCAELVIFERYVGLAEQVTVADSAHYFTEEGEWFYHNSRSRPIVIGENVWVCPKVTITSGVTIGDHTIIGSNSVVVDDVPSGVLVSGIPATVVRKLDLPWKDRG